MINFNDLNKTQNYNLLISCNSIESRSSHIRERLDSSYDNSCVFQLNDGKVTDTVYNNTPQNTTNLDKLEEALQLGEFIAIDYSSMPRNLLGKIISKIDLYAKESKSTKDLDIHFLYAHAIYSPALDEYGPIIKDQPVDHYFIGDNLPENTNTSLILGVGYEKDIALGLIEKHEPDVTLLFLPSDHGSEYSRAIKNTNEGLFHKSNKLKEIPYNVFSPQSLFNSLCSAILGLQNKPSRPLIIPLGPKPFTLCSLIACCTLNRSFSVWQIESRDGRVSDDREASGKISISSICWRL